MHIWFVLRRHEAAGLDEMTRTLTSRNILFIGITLFLVLLSLYSYPSLISPRPWQLLQCPPKNESNDAHLSTPVKRHNVVVASHFGYHFDVYMALTWTLERVTKNPVTVYVTEQPFHHRYNEFLDNSGLHRGPILSLRDLFHDLTTVPANGRMIDMVIFGTCEVE